MPLFVLRPITFAWDFRLAKMNGLAPQFLIAFRLAWDTFAETEWIPIGMGRGCDCKLTPTSTQA